MTLTNTDIKKVREIVREETADIVHKIDYLPTRQCSWKKRLIGIQLLLEVIQKKLN